MSRLTDEINVNSILPIPRDLIIVDVIISNTDSIIQLMNERFTQFDSSEFDSSVTVISNDLFHPQRKTNNALYNPPHVINNVDPHHECAKIC